MPKLVNIIPLVFEKLFTHSLVGYANYFISNHQENCEIVNCYICYRRSVVNLILHIK